MSSKSNVTAAANRGAHRITGEEAAEDVVPSVALRQGTPRKLATSSSGEQSC